MTVLENMLVPGLARPHSTKDRGAACGAAASGVPWTGRAGGVQAKNLSGGQQKLLELGRALMLDPEILFLDEPFAGVNPFLRNEIIELVQKAARARAAPLSLSIMTWRHAAVGAAHGGDVARRKDR